MKNNNFATGKIFSEICAQTELEREYHPFHELPHPGFYEEELLLIYLALEYSPEQLEKVMNVTD